MLQRGVLPARGGSLGRWPCGLSQEAQVASEENKNKRSKIKMRKKNICKGENLKTGGEREG